MTDAAAATGANQDYAALLAERDELRARLDAAEGPRLQKHRVRQVVAGLLVGLACLAFLAAMPGLWASRNFLDTDRFVSRVGPLPEDPAVREVLTTRLTEQIMLLVDPRELFEEVLPERGQLLAAPLANAVEGFVRDRVAGFVASEPFERLWVAAATLAHRTALNVLEGESDVVTTADGQVTLNLIPVVDAVLKQITSASPEILGREVDLPDVSVEDIPASAIQRLESALDVDLDDDFGQFTVYDQGKLEAAQDALHTFGRFVGLLLPLAIVAAGLAVWTSTKRRRTVLQLAAGTALAAVVVRRVTFALEDEVAALAPTDEGRRAVAVVVDAFLTPLMTFAVWTLAGAALVTVVALLTGPSRWAVATRSRGASLWRSLTTSATSHAHDQTTQSWIREHRDEVMICGAVIGVLVIWLADLSWFGVLVVLVAVGGFLAAIHRIAGTGRPAEIDNPDAGAPLG